MRGTLRVRDQLRDRGAYLSCPIPHCSCPFQYDHRRSQRSSIVKLFHEIETGQHGLHVGPLNAAAASVDEPDFAKTVLARLLEILARDVSHFVRTERMKIERLLDRNGDRIGGGLILHARDSMRYSLAPTRT